MKKICLVCGGNSTENEISILTALRVKQEFINNKWPYIFIYLNRSGSFFDAYNVNDIDDIEQVKIKKGTFFSVNGKYYFKTRGRKQHFDYVLPLVHGNNVEDGTLASYFKTLNIPVISSSIFSSAIIQDKCHFKDLAKYYKIPVTKYAYFTKEMFLESEEKSLDLLSKLKYPLIIKPSHLGSSIGIRKILNKKELLDQINFIFTIDDSLIVEEAVCNLKEYNIAIFKYKTKLILSLIEEVNSKDKILSYEAKYIPTSKDYETRLIGTEIDKELKEKIESIAKVAYQKFECNGIVRFDFLYNEISKNLYLNEPNSIPGSLAYYLFEKEDYKFSNLLNDYIEQSIENAIEARRLYTTINNDLVKLLKQGSKKIK